MKKHAARLTQQIKSGFRKQPAIAETIANGTRRYLSTYHLIQFQIGADEFTPLEQPTIEEAAEIKVQTTPVQAPIVEEAAHIDAQDQDGNTKLILAAANSPPSRVIDVLQQGPNLNIKNKKANPALYYAVAYGRKEVVCLLLEAGAKIEDKIFSTAKGCSNPEVKYIIENYAQFGSSVFSIELKEDSRSNLPIDAQGQDGNTKLILAAANGTPAEVLNLIQQGANVNIKNKNGYTALYLASVYDRKEIVSLLLDAGATFDEEKYVTAAKNCGHLEVVSLLLANRVRMQERAAPTRTM